MPRWTMYGGGELSVEDGEVLLRESEEGVEERWSAEAFVEIEGIWQRVDRSFDLMTASELKAWLRHGEELLAEDRASWAQLEGRPQIERIFHDPDVERRGWIVFLNGRRVSWRVGEIDKGECSFEEFLERGLSEEAIARLGDQYVALCEGIRALESVPCHCGTGVERSMQHGDLRGLASVYSSWSYVDDSASTCQCKVCKRLWSFRECGDSHYSYDYRKRSWDPWKV